MENVDLEQAVLELVGKPDYRPVKSRVIAQQLQLSKDQASEVKKAVKRLVSQGLLAYGSGRQVEPVAPADPKGNRIVGVFRRMEAGYGFVRPTGTIPAEARAADVYIPAQKSGDASTGDLVMVQRGRRRLPPVLGLHRRSPRQQHRPTRRLDQVRIPQHGRGR